MLSLSLLNSMEVTMYGIIRLIIVLIIITFIIKKKTETKDKIVVLVLGVVVVTLLNFVPIENLFVDFSSPESVYKYVQSPFEDIKVVVPGKKSDMIIAKKNKSAYNVLVVPKTEDGWKIGNGLDLKPVCSRWHEDVSVNVQKYSKKGDYYITVTDMKSEVKKITDINNSEFISIYCSVNGSQSQVVKYYTSVQNFNEQYWIEINGEKLYLVQENQLGETQGPIRGRFYD